MIGLKDSDAKNQQFTFFNEELQNEQISSILTNFSTTLDILENDLNYAVEARDSKDVFVNEHIKLDTYLAYANSTLFWIFLKLQGSDLSKVSMLKTVFLLK